MKCGLNKILNQIDKVHWGLRCLTGAALSLSAFYVAATWTTATTVFGGVTLFLLGCFIIVSAVPGEPEDE